ncbi:MAG: DUF1365 domain-containing protein [Gammaproteobacteria bacterium]
MRSCIYTGEVFHRRTGPRTHDLRYSVFYLLLDLDELDRIAGASRLFGYNRRAWFAFNDRDHGAGDGSAYRAWLERALTRTGLSEPRWRFRVLCMPRVMGYVFNPITVVYAERADGSVAAMIYEVNNTFGERIAYVAPVNGPGRIRQRCDKAMFVSPFFEMDGHYEFSLDAPGERLELVIDYRDAESLRLRALFSGRREALTPSALRRLAATFPMLTLKVIAAIHFEALKIWLKGVPLVRHVAMANRNTVIGKST